MNAVTIVPMAIGIVLALFGMSKQKSGATWGQPMAILGAIIAIGAALYNVVGQATGGSSNAIADREQRYMFIQGKFLGQEIKKAVPACKKVVVLVDAMSKFDVYGEPLAEPREDHTLKGLKEGLGADVTVETICQTVPKRQRQVMKGPNGEEMEMPMMPVDMMSSREFKQLEKQIKSGDVFVALSMLPMDISLPQCLGMIGKGNKVALMNPGADTDTLKKVFDDGGKSIADVVAAVVTKKSAIYDDKIPSNDKAAFDRRYVLITKGDYAAALDAASK